MVDNLSVEGASFLKEVLLLLLLSLDLVVHLLLLLLLVYEGAQVAVYLVYLRQQEAVVLVVQEQRLGSRQVSLDGGYHVQVGQLVQLHQILLYVL